MTRGKLRIVLALLLLGLGSGCASGPKRPAAPPPDPVSFPALDIPAGMQISPAVRDRFVAGTKRLQAGDTRGASRDFADVLKRDSHFYPAEAALGFAALAGKSYKLAATHFAAATAANDSYLPAWLGQAEALLALNRDAEAIAAMERILVLDPKREPIRARLELVRFRALQGLVEAGRKARASRKFDEADRVLQQALALSPSSTLILQELMQVQLDAGRLADAEASARRAVELEPADATWQAALGQVLETQEEYRLAADAYAAAAAIDPRAEWRTKAADLRKRADLAAIPAEFARIETAASVSRADIAAYIGIHLAGLLERAPARVTEVATDVRSHWAAPWILPVTRAGLMSILPNHTFQPGASVRRIDLAAIVADLLRVATSGRPAELARWQAGRPRFADLPATNVTYRAAALAVAAGAMGANAENRFEPTRAVTGAELVAAMRRVDLLSHR